MAIKFSRAAKLSSLRERSVSTIITATIYDRMPDSAKFGGVKSENMWTDYNWETGRPYVVSKVYGSTWGGGSRNGCISHYSRIPVRAVRSPENDQEWSCGWQDNETWLPTRRGVIPLGQPE
jgi:hypothetical protein